MMDMPGIYYVVEKMLICRETPITYRNGVARRCLARRGWDSGFEPHYGIKTSSMESEAVAVVIR